MGIKKNIIWLSLILLALIIITGCAKNRYSTKEVDTFAKCLTENGATMYGAFWCPHCAKTKKKFGSSFKYIKYVECDPRGDNEQSELCIQKKIDKYDTWEFTDGSRVVGEPSFETLSSKTNCKMPLEVQ